MSAGHAPGLPAWSIAGAVAGLAVAIAKLAHVELPVWLVGPVLVAAVLAAVHHAEVIAARIGEPFGTLVLAIAVTTIEVGLIVSLMLTGGEGTTSLARDTVFAAVMIILNGILGGALLLAGMKHHEPGFNLSGTNSALTVLTALTVLSMLLPNVTETTRGPVYAPSQLAFVAVVSVVLYLSFVFVQTVRHRDHFLTGDGEGNPGPRPAQRVALMALALLVAALFGVVMAGKALSPVIEASVAAAGLPPAVVGVVIAAIVLLPEGLSALKAARANRLQDSINLALGSAVASIGLTIPAVAVVSLMLGLPLTLGLGALGSELLVLSLFLAVLSLRTGRTTVLNGIVHLTIFAVYLFVTVVP